MKPKRRCQHVYEDGGTCDLVKAASVHGGEGWDHDFVDVGQQRARPRMRSRSEKTARYYREERVPAVSDAVGHGRRPCQIKAPGCTGHVQGLHEPATRGRFGGLEPALKAAAPIPCCHACNRYVGEHPVWARERGFLRRNRKGGLP